MAAATPVYAVMMLALAIALMAAGGANALSCNTNGNSPTQSAANTCVQFIRNLGDTQCCQQNCGGDFCTTMCQTDGARVMICGDCNKCTSCSTAGGSLNNVLAQCTRNVGGTARCSGNDNAAGFAFVIDIVHNGDGVADTNNEVIEMLKVTEA
jgi:hypothetical protein